MARNRDVAPCFRVTGTVDVFSASPPVLRATGSRKPTGAGFCWRPAGFVEFSRPGLFAAFSPFRRKPATGGELPGPPDPGVSKPPGNPPPPRPRYSTSPVVHRAKGPGDDYRTTFPARSHPAARDWPWRQTPSPRDGMRRMIRPLRGAPRKSRCQKRMWLKGRDIFPPMRLYWRQRHPLSCRHPGDPKGGA